MKIKQTMLSVALATATMFTAGAAFAGHQYKSLLKI